MKETAQHCGNRPGKDYGTRKWSTGSCLLRGLARVVYFVCEGASISTLCSSCDPVVDLCFSCDTVVIVFHPVLAFVDPESFWCLKANPVFWNPSRRRDRQTEGWSGDLLVKMAAKANAQAEAEAATQGDVWK